MAQDVANHPYLSATGHIRRKAAPLPGSPAAKRRPQARIIAGAMPPGPQKRMHLMA